MLVVVVGARGDRADPMFEDPVLGVAVGERFHRHRQFSARGVPIDCSVQKGLFA